MMVVGRRSKPERSGSRLFARDEAGSPTGTALLFLVVDGDNEGGQNGALLAMGEHLHLTVYDRADGVLVGGLPVVLQVQVA